MKMITIVPVEMPESFQTVKFTQLDWKAARTAGEITAPYVTAMEALRNSRGLYRIKPAEKDTLRVEIQGLKAPAEMTSAELVAEMTSHGKPPRKRMNRETAIEFVKELRAKAEAMIVDDDSEADDE